MTGRVLHPELTPGERRRLIHRGIELFNAGRFFDSHEELEEVWRSTTPEPRDLFQGLIQVAAGMHHWLDRGRPGPARRVMGRGRRRLEGLPPDCCGLAVLAVIERVREWEAWLERRSGPAPAPPAIEIVDPGRVR